jgi:hypothetical protein
MAGLSAAKLPAIHYRYARTLRLTLQTQRLWMAGTAFGPTGHDDCVL